MLRFHDVLEVDGRGAVVATGPRDSTTEEIVELCAWVFQRGDHDAAATEMTHDGHLLVGEGELEVMDDKWRLPLGKVGEDAALISGDAFAVAVAMLKEGGKQRVVWWGHPVKLRDAGSAGS